jgi:hypothetical protein
MSDEDKKNEIAVWQPSEFEGEDLLPVSMMDEEADLSGRDQIRTEDIILPTLKVLQPTSEECNDYDGAEPGLLWHSGCMEVFRPPVRAIAIAHNRSNALFPKEDNPRYAGLQQCLARDGEHGDVYGECAKCPNLEWGANNEPALCSASQNFILMTEFGPCMIRFSRSSHRAGKDFLSQWMGTRKPIFAHPVIIDTASRVKVVGRKQVTYWVQTMRWQVREKLPPEVKEMARDSATFFQQALKEKKVSVEDRSDEDRDTPAEDIPF